MPAERISAARNWDVRKSSVGDDSQPIFSTAGEINLTVNLFKASVMAASPENTDLTVPSDPRMEDQTR